MTAPTGDWAPLRRAARRATHPFGRCRRTYRSSSPTPLHRAAVRRGRSCGCRTGLADPTELTGPVFGRDAVTAADADLTIGPGGEAVGQRIIVTGRLLDGAGRPIRRSLVEIWQANASGRYRHRGDQWPGMLDPNFTGGGRTLTDDDGDLPVHHHQARRVSVGQPRQRLATGAHPLLGVRLGLHPAARHADVLPRRPAVLPGPDLQLDRRPGRAPTARRRLRPRRDRGSSGRSASASTSSCAARRRPRSRSPAMAELTPSQTVGPFLHLALADPALATPVAADDTDGDRRWAARSSTATAAAVPDAVVETWQYGGPFARCATGARTGPGRCASADPLRCRRWTARPRHPTSPCRCSPAACSTASSPAPTSTATRPTPTTRSSPRVGDRAGRLLAQPAARARGASTSDLRDEVTMSPSSSSSDPFRFLAAPGRWRA